MPGFPGINGIPGTQGPPGSSGIPGLDGCNGTDVIFYSIIFIYRKMDCNSIIFINKDFKKVF